MHRVPSENINIVLIQIVGEDFDHGFLAALSCNLVKELSQARIFNKNNSNKKPAFGIHIEHKLLYFSLNSPSCIISGSPQFQEENRVFLPSYQTKNIAVPLKSPFLANNNLDLYYSQIMMSP